MSASGASGLVSGALYRCEAGEVRAGHEYAVPGFKISGRVVAFWVDPRGVVYAVLQRGKKKLRVQARKIAEAVRGQA